MTDKEVQKLIDVIESATKEALKSKASAHKFLVDAGIVKERPTIKSPSEKKK